ncbi:MAG: site-specific integrase [Desulfovibrio sp.]|nr:site-specific integrase [Desulfovibrio sp.]
MEEAAEAVVEAVEPAEAFAGLPAPAAGPDLEALLIRWSESIDALPGTRAEYVKASKQFLSFLHVRGQTRPCEDDVVAWKQELAEVRHLAPGTIGLYLTAVRRLFAWLARRGLYVQIADAVAGPRRTAGYRRDDLSVSQIQDLIASVQGDGERERRDRALLRLMSRCGLRTVEIERADVEDMRTLAGCPVLFVQGKGRGEKCEYVKLPQSVERALRSYLADRTVRREADGRTPLFSSLSDRNLGCRLGRSTIRHMVKDRLRSIGLDSKRLSAHSLRHSCATTALRAGVPLADVQAVLRHRSASTTMLYAHALAREANNTESIVDGVMEGTVPAEKTEGAA